MTPQTPTTLTRVTGIDGAKAYQMTPNSTVALFDNNEDIMYIKTTDGAGFPTIRTFLVPQATWPSIVCLSQDVHASSLPLMMVMLFNITRT